MNTPFLKNVFSFFLTYPEMLNKYNLHEKGEVISFIKEEELWNLSTQYLTITTCIMVSWNGLVFNSRIAILIRSFSLIDTLIFFIQRNDVVFWTFLYIEINLQGFCESFFFCFLKKTLLFTYFYIFFILFIYFTTITKQVIHSYINHSRWHVMSAFFCVSLFDNSKNPFVFNPG